MAGDGGAWDSFMTISQELGFGSLEENDFVWCGKRVRRRPEDEVVCISMEAYHENPTSIYVHRARRADLDAPLDAKELRSFRAACGSLQWLVAQLRVDVAFKVSVLQGELKAPTVGSLLKASAVIAECRNTADFFLPFGMCDLENGGILGVSDAALGNVNDRGTEGAENEKDSRVHSQAGYLCFFADQAVLRGGRGRVFLWTGGLTA